MEAWLRDGLQRQSASNNDEDRRRAFECVTLGTGDAILEIIAAVPDAEKVTLAIAVRNALATGEAGCGGPVNLAAVLAMARSLRPPGVVPPLFSLWQRRSHAGTPVGQMIELELFHTASILAGGGSEEALRFIDNIRDDPDRWREDFADLWLRAKVRAGPAQNRPVSWTRGLSELQEEFTARIERRFRMHRFLDDLLSDAGSLTEIRHELETWRAHQDGLPWFISQLFGWGGPLRIGLRGEERVLFRLVAADSRHERVAATLSLDEPLVTAAARGRHRFWSDIMAMCYDIRIVLSDGLARREEDEADNQLSVALALTANLFGKQQPVQPWKRAA